MALPLHQDPPTAAPPTKGDETAELDNKMETTVADHQPLLVEEYVGEGGSGEDGDNPLLPTAGSPLALSPQTTPEKEPAPCTTSTDAANTGTDCQPEVAPEGGPSTRLPLFTRVDNHGYSNEEDRENTSHSGETQVLTIEPEEKEKMMMMMSKPKMVGIMSKGKQIFLKHPKPTKSKRKYTKSKKPLPKGQETISKYVQSEYGSEEPRLGHQSTNNVKKVNPISKAEKPKEISKLEDIGPKSKSTTAQVELPAGGMKTGVGDKDKGAKIN